MCEPDPMLAMLEWLCYQMTEAEVNEKLGEKRESTQKKYRSPF